MNKNASKYYKGTELLHQNITLIGTHPFITYACDCINTICQSMQDKDISNF